MRGQAVIARRRVFGLAVALIALGAHVTLAADRPTGKLLASAEDLNTLHPDPQVRQGTLANGLRYVVMRNATPSSGISLRLALNVGAYEETEAQLGAAHLIEHLAFSNGNNAHETGPERAFAQAGVAFGRDINAETDRFSTIYRLDLPQVEPEALNLAFSWLRAVADGTHFTEAAVDRERGVVLAERSARLSPSVELENERAAFQTPNLRAIRPIVGTLDSLHALNAVALEAFYKAWYRPDNAVVVAVGDVDPAILQSLVEKAFGSWAGQGPAPARSPPQRPDEARGEDAITFVEPQLATQIRACRVRAPEPEGPDDVARLRGRLLTRLWTRLIDAQLEQASHEPKPPYLQATIDEDDLLRDARLSCLRVMPLDERWEPALAAAQAEVARFLAHGPSQEELDDLVVALRARIRGARDDAATRSSIGLANDFAQYALKKETILSPNEEFWAFDAAVETITPEDVRKAFARAWSGAGPLLSIQAPQPPTAQVLKTAWDEDAARPTPGSAPAAKSLRWAYADFGKPGRVKDRTVLKDPDFVRLIFANGLVMNFKQTAFQKGEVEVRVRLGAGRREIADDDYFAVVLGTGLMPSGGLGRHDLSEINRLFANKAWQVAMSMSNEAFLLQGKTNVASLRSELQILAAYLSDPGFRSDLDARIPTAIDAAYRGQLGQPATALSFAVADAIAPGSPATLPPQSRTASLRMADFQRILKPILTEAPLDITLVGDIDEVEATELVAQTFGALPMRKAASRGKGSTWFLRFPDQPPTIIRTTHEGSANQAVAGLFWPLYVATPERRREEIALTVLAGVMSDELRHRVRQELGKTYSPGATTVMPDHADQGYLMAEIETAPADIEVMTAEARQVAQRLANGEITPEALEAVRRPLAAEYAARKSRNSWWVAVLSGSSVNPARLEEMRTEPDLLARLTVEDVRGVAAAWLTRPPIVVIAAPKPRAAAAASTAAAAH